jgi:hypothetical protein
MGVYPAPGCGVFLSFLVEVNLLPFLGGRQRD